MTTTITARDHASGVDRHRYHHTRVVETCGCIVRVRVVRDSYSQQSCAVAEVLADNLTWTHLADDAASNWWHNTPPPSLAVHAETELGDIADRLVRRAAEILAPPVTER